MEGIHEDGYQSTEEDEFHLTTSGEFCDGASRRTRAMDLPGVLEELDLEELKLWDQEELESHRRSRPTVPATEVIQLLREVPPSLRSRYCARLRAEAQRRRAAEIHLEARGRGATLKTGFNGWTGCFICFMLVLGAWAHSNGNFGHLGSTETFPAFTPVSPEMSRQRRAGVPPQGVEMPGGCPEALKKAEAEAIALEVLTRRDIMGYNQMLTSIHDWTSNQHPLLPASIASCLKVEGPRFLNLVETLRSNLLAAHARAARARARVTMERNARIFLSEGGS